MSTLSNDPDVIQRELTALRKKLKSATNGNRRTLALSISHRERKLKRIGADNAYGTDDALDAMNAAQEASEGKWAASADASGAPHIVNFPDRFLSKPDGNTSGRILIRVGSRTILRGTFECPAGVTVEELMELESTFDLTNARVFLDLE